MKYLYLLMILSIVVLLIYSAEYRKKKRLQQQIDDLVKGDEFVFNGIIAKVTRVGDDYIQAEISDGVEVLCQKAAISQVIRHKGVEL